MGNENQRSLAYPSLITILCEEAKVPIDPNDIPIQKPKWITSTTIFALAEHVARSPSAASSPSGPSTSTTSHITSKQQLNLVLTGITQLKKRTIRQAQLLMQGMVCLEAKMNRIAQDLQVNDAEQDGSSCAELLHLLCDEDPVEEEAEVEENI